VAKWYEQRMTARAVCLDVMGTLFDLSAPRRRLEALGAPAAALEAWFGRLLHTAAVVTLIDDYRPFPELAKPVLESVLAQLDLDPDGAAHVLGALAELDPYPDAGPALERLASAGVQLVALTNGTAQNTRKLLARAGLERYVGQVLTTDAVGRYKPHAAVYRYAVERLAVPAAEVTLVAAHGWDVAGARAAGLGAIWVSRLEHCWPLPPPQPPTTEDLAGAADQILAG
jgi:2-haloacid dehalogenase